MNTCHGCRNLKAVPDDTGGGLYLCTRYPGLVVGGYGGIYEDEPRGCDDWEGKEMAEHGVMRFMGRFPDAINPKQRLMSKVWVCGQCGARIESRKSMTVPKQCQCGCIGWMAASKS